jgi:hypothetical protein
MAVVEAAEAEAAREAVADSEAEAVAVSGWAEAAPVAMHYSS